MLDKKRSFTTRDIYNLLSIPETTTHSYVHQGLVKPSIRYTGFRRSPMLFSLSDLNELRLIRGLRNYNVSFVQIRKLLLLYRQSAKTEAETHIAVIDSQLKLVSANIPLQDLRVGEGIIILIPLVTTDLIP